MTLQRVTNRRWRILSAAIGFIVWLLFLWLAPRHSEGTLLTIENLLLLAILVHAPLALHLVAQWDGVAAHPFLYRLIGSAQPVAASAVLISFALPNGLAALLLALPWAIVAGLAALYSLFRLVQPGGRTTPELCVSAGLLYLPVGALWLLASRYGFRPLNFPAVIVLLTAIHFHYTGFAVPIIAGVTGRFLVRCEQPLRNYAWISSGVILATPLIALGITLSSFVEVAGVSIIFASIVGLALLTAKALFSQDVMPPARWLLALASVSMVFAITCAGLYGLGEFMGRTLIAIPYMVQLHGWTNAFGFVLTGLAGWILVDSEKMQPVSPTLTDQMGVL